MINFLELAQTAVAQVSLYPLQVIGRHHDQTVHGERLLSLLEHLSLLVLEQVDRDLVGGECENADVPFDRRTFDEVNRALDSLAANSFCDEAHGFVVELGGAATSVSSFKLGQD